MATDLFLIDYEPIILNNNPPLTYEEKKNLDAVLNRFKDMAEEFDLHLKRKQNANK